ncbi:MAG: hypothetical protein AB201_00070 [Parcubacteria bacterium C7867-006]|nr:MAG: hypothetical protein AB201_00070 [Parcubacteria bacterium C7867-006]
MRYSILILILVLTLGFAGIAKAQFNVISTEVNLELIPENPNPNEIVQASISSYGTNLNAATITWVVNGKTQKSGVGEKSINFTVGDIGTKTSLNVIIQTVDGEMIERSISINPSSVDLIWQSTGFVPPFYKGKTLFSHQNNLTVIAIPHIISATTELSAKSLIYTWKKDGTVMDYASGYGKNSFTFQGSLISRPIKIEVVVSSPSSNTTAYAHTTITPIEPDVLIYKKDPLYGIEFQKALSGAFNIDSLSEINVIAMPFFFGVTDAKSSDLTYKWSINGKPIGNAQDTTTQVFRRKEGVSGSSNISVSIENSDKILQYAGGGFKLVFNGQTQSSI